MKKTFKLIGIAVIAAVIVFSFAACPQESGPASMTFRGSDGGGDYTLKITQDAANKAVFTIKANDAYELTYTGGGSSKGKVTPVSGDTFILTPNDTSKPAITAKVSGSDTLTGLTANTGTNIVWDNGSQTAAPGTAITPPAPPPASGSATITVTNQQLYGYSSISGPYTAYNGIGNVYAVYEYWNEETEEYEPVGDEIGAVTNGKLSFTLQKAPPAEALGLLTAGMSAGVTVSDKNAKWIIVSFNFSDGSEIYELDCRYLDGPNFNSLVYWYIDKDVSVKGSYNDAGYTFYIDLSLKKGFNAVYQAGTGDSMKMTTAKPADADLLKWIYHNMGL